MERALILVEAEKNSLAYKINTVNLLEISYAGTSNQRLTVLQTIKQGFLKVL